MSIRSQPRHGNVTKEEHARRMLTAINEHVIETAKAVGRIFRPDEDKQWFYSPGIHFKLEPIIPPLPPQT